MPLQRLELLPGIIKDESPLVSRPRWIDCDRMRFTGVGGRPEPIGGWQPAASEALRGKARAVHVWSRLDGVPVSAFGTHRGLYVLAYGRLWLVTPIRSTATLGSNPVATEAGSAVVTITHTAHGGIDGAIVYLTGATAVGGITIGGTSVTPTNPITTSAASRIVSIADTAHGLADGDIVAISSASAVGGVTLSGDYTVRVQTADSYVVEHSVAATSSATGGGTPTLERWRGYVIDQITVNTYTVTHSAAAASMATGGGSGVKVKYEINPSREDAAAGLGYGTGTFGSGLYSVGDRTTGFVGTWTLDNFGEALIANPRRGGIYRWEGNLSTRAAVLSGAPATADWIFVSPELHIVAGGVDWGSGYDPMNLATSDVADPTGWTPGVASQATQKRLGSGSRLVRGLAAESQNLLWTNRQLIAMRYQPTPPDVWSFPLVGIDCGLIGVNAVVLRDGKGWWVGNNQQFWVYDGSSPRVVPCEVRDFFFSGLNDGQADKIFVGANTTFAELWVFYPSAESLEVDRYLAWNWQTGVWVIGTVARTCWADHNVLGNPLAVDPDGQVFRHEVGTSAAGAPMGAFIESSPFEIGTGEQKMDIFDWLPDFERLTVGAFMTLTARHHPTATDQVFGPYLATPSTDLVNLRAAGRQATVKISFVDDANAWGRLGDLRLRIEAAGRRR